MCFFPWQVSSASMGGRCAIHVPSCGRQTCLLLLVALLLPWAWPLLIKVYWAIRYGMRYVSALASPNFLFSYRNIVGTGGFSGRAIMRPRDVVLLDMPLVTPTPTLLWLGLLLPLFPAIHLPIPHHQVWQCFAHIKHLRHQHITLAWFASSPLHPPFTYPFHTTRSGSALLTSSTWSINTLLQAWFASSPLHCHLFVHSPSPNRFLPQYMARWLYVWVIWVFIECESWSPHIMILTQQFLVLGVFPPYLFFFLWWYVFLFIVCFGGFGGCESWQGSQPLSCLLVSFHFLHCLVTGVVFWLGWIKHNFVMKWMKMGNLCQFICPNPNPK